MTRSDILRFPCTCVPEDPTYLRLLGVYPQRQDGCFMQRIKLHGGVLAAAQWRDLARMAEAYTPGTPLSLTTRQDIEFHNVSSAVLPRLQQDIAEAGLTGQGACGDTLRAMTICPGNGLCAGTPDVSDVAMAVRKVLEAFSGISTLPRKFKVSFSSCDRACGQPWIHDLAFVALPGTGTLSFKVIGAGSLGPKPATGIELCSSLPAERVPGYAISCLHLFFEHGDRAVRSKARLRHVRERMGNRSFAALLDDYVHQHASAEHPSLAVIPPMTPPGWHRVAVLSPPCAQITPTQVFALADLIETTGCVTRLDTHHRIALYAREPETALTAFNAAPLLHPLAAQNDIAACLGTTYCRHALADTHAAELLLRRCLAGRQSPSIRISGCPNGCAHSAVAQIGLVGRRRKNAAGHSVEGFQVLTAGGMGETPARAQLLEEFVPSDRIAGVVETLLQ